MPEPVFWLEWLEKNTLAVVAFVLAAAIVVAVKAFWTHVMIPVKDAVIAHMLNLDDNLTSHTKALDSLVIANDKINTTLSSLCVSSECQAQMMTDLRDAVNDLQTK